MSPHLEICLTCPPSPKTPGRVEAPMKAFIFLTIHTAIGTYFCT